MNKLISSQSVGYICFTAVLITAMVGCESGSEVSAEAISANAQSCIAAGQVQYFHQGPGVITMECRAKKD